MGAPRSRPTIDTLDDFFDEESHERATPTGAELQSEDAGRRTTPPPGDYDPEEMSTPTAVRGARASAAQEKPLAPSTYLVVAVPPSELRSMPIDARMAYVIGLADGATLADVIDASSMPAAETARIVADLVRLGALRREDPISRRRGT